MGQVSICQNIAQIIEPIIKQSGLDLVDIEYKKEGKCWFLRIFIDKENGVTVDDCQKVSHEVEDIIEIEDLIKRKYILEVSSPGLDRSLKKEKDFLRNKTRRIRVSTFQPIHDKKSFLGVVNDFRNQSLFLEVGGDLLEIPLSSISKAKLEIDFTGK